MKPSFDSFDYCKHLATLMWFLMSFFDIVIDCFKWNCNELWNQSTVTRLCYYQIWPLVMAFCIESLQLCVLFSKQTSKNTVNLIWQFLIEDGLYLTNFSWITLTKILNGTYEITLSFKMCQNKMQFFMKKLLCWSGTDLLCLLWILFTQKPHNFGMK